MATYPLKRSLLDRVFGGVCGGVGGYLRISGWWLRVAFLALLLTNFSFGILLYILLWLILPDQKISDLPSIIVMDGDQDNPPRLPRYTRPESVLTVGAVSIIVGIIVLAETTGVLRYTGGDLLAPSMLVLIGIVLLLKQLRGMA